MFSCVKLKGVYRDHAAQSVLVIVWAAQVYFEQYYSSPLII